MYKFQVIIIAGMLISLTAGAFADEYFSAPSAQLVYGFYNRAVCDDFDNDGDIDIVSHHPSFSGLHYITLILNDGNGRFNPVDSISLGERGRAIHLRDLNGDGFNDVAFTRYDNAVGVLYSNGDGSFQPVHYYGSPLSTDWITSVDLDDDNDFDLIAAGGSWYISVLKNNGAGSFDPYVYYYMGYVISQIISADFDNDGDLDLAAAIPDNNCISVIMNTGNGVINTPQTYQSGIYPRVLNSADINNDSYNDIVVASGFGYLDFFINNGDGSFQNYDSMYVDGDIISIDLSDLNNDGDNDIIVATLNFNSLPSITDDVYVLSGNGDGTFTEPINYRVAVDPYMAVSADFNNDDYNDILVTGVNFVFMINNGDGTFPSPDKYVVGEYPYEIAMVDLDRDHDLDLVTTRPYSNRFSLLFNDGNGFYPETFSQQTWNQLYSVTSADFDHDGTNDIAIADAGQDKVQVYMKYEIPAFQVISVNVNDSPYRIIADDFNNDGFYDLATANWNSFSVILNQTGTFSSATNYPASQVSPSICASDFNNDNFIDLALSTDIDSTVVVWLNNGRGAFSFNAAYLVGNYPTSICSGDFDNDLDMDLAVSDRGNRGIWILLNDGSGDFQPPVFCPGSCYEANSIVAFDLEMDGDIDLATIAGGFSQMLSIYANDGDATFQNIVNYAAGDTPLRVRAGDLDNDGMTDLAFASNDGNYINVLLNQLEPIRTLDNDFSEPIKPYRNMSVYPNPFNKQTMVTYELPHESHVKVVIYDILGRNVVTLIDCDQKTGKYQVNWDARNQASGLYFTKIQIDDYSDTKKMILMK